MSYSLFSQAIIASNVPTKSSYIFGIAAIIIETGQLFIPLLPDSKVDYNLRLMCVSMHLVLLRGSSIFPFSSFLTTDNNQILTILAFLSCNLNVLLIISFMLIFVKNTALFGFILSTPLILRYQMDIIHQRYVSAFLQQLTSLMVQLAAYSIFPNTLNNQFVFRMIVQFMVYIFFSIDSCFNTKNELKFQFTFKIAVLKIFLYNALYSAASIAPSFWIGLINNNNEFLLTNIIFQSTFTVLGRFSCIIYMQQTRYLSFIVSLVLIMGVALTLSILLKVPLIGLIELFAQIVLGFSYGICVVYQLPGMMWQLFAIPHLIVLACSAPLHGREAVKALNTYVWADIVSIVGSVVFLIGSYRMSHRERLKLEFLDKL